MPGAGIAQAALMAALPAVVYDASPEQEFVSQAQFAALVAAIATYVTARETEEGD